jgi:DnaK suppressor protein
MSLSKADVKVFRDRLQALRARLRGDVEDLRDGAFGGDDSESRSPTHPAELGTENYEQDFALDLIRNEQDTLKEIAVALKKCEDGTFGLCEGCLVEGKTQKQAAILKTRLKEIPWARNCVECQRKSEVEY